MLDASKSFTKCPWLVTEKNRATSSTLLRIVHTPPVRLGRLRDASDAGPLLPSNLGESASARAPQSSQLVLAGSSPNVASWAFNLLVLGKVCSGCGTAPVVVGCELPGPAA